MAVLGAALAGRAALRRARYLDLRGKKVLITGGSRGLGFAAARLFVDAGADVVICARDAVQLERAEQALREIARTSKSNTNGDSGSRIVALRADVTDPRATEMMVAQALLALGGIDVLVNCAVEIAIGPLEAMTAEDFEQAFQGIFFAVYHPMMALLPHMRARKAGRIVNVTSVAGKALIPHNSTYVAGKFATTGFSQVSAAELRKYGIYVSTVMPPPLRNGAWMNAGYKGNSEQELFWFARALHSPLTSVDTERAARAIVQAARYGDVELMVSPTAWLHSRLHSLFPGFSVALAAAAEARFMPKTPPGARALPAASAEQILTTSTNPDVQSAARNAQRDAEHYLQPLALRIDPSTGVTKPS
jgi:NAD(P)-dependent dehydrogenase (short-subunit alcohol dehydrogenase family)